MTYSAHHSDSGDGGSNHPPETSAPHERQSVDEVNDREQVLDLVNHIQDQLQHVRDLQLQQEQDHKALLERYRSLEDRERQLTEKVEQLNQQQSQLKEREADIAERYHQLQAEAEQVSDQKRDLDRLRNELVERQQHLDDQQTALERQRADIQGRADEESRELARRQSELNELQRRLEEEQEQASAKWEELTHRQRQIEAREQELESARVGLAQQHAHTTEQCEALQREVDAANQRIAELSKSLDETSRQLEDKSTELAALQAGLAHKQEHASEQCEVLQREVDAANQRIAELNDSLNDSSEQLKEKSAEVSALQAELHKQKSRIAEHDSVLAERDQQIQSLKSQCDEKAGELDELRKRLAAHQEDRSKIEQMNARLKSHAMKIRSAADHIKQRRQRLKNYRAALSRLRRKLLKERSEYEIEVRSKVSRELDGERENIASTRHALACAEQAMIRRWAGHRAVMSVAFLAILAAICAVGSWIAAGYFFPSPVVASVDLEARPRPGQVLSAEDLRSWNEQVIDLLSSPTFRTAMSSRLTEQRFDRWRGAGQVDSLLDDHLSVDAVVPGRLTLTLNVKEPPTTAVAILDTISTTLTVEFSQRAARRSDDPRTVVVTERRERGRVRHANLDTRHPGGPIDQNRVMLAAGSTLVTFFGVLALIGVATWRLSKTRGMFEDQISVDVDAED